MISYTLNPKTGCEIYRDGVLVAVCSLAEKNARLQALGYQAPKAPRYGWSQTGKQVTRRGAR